MATLVERIDTGGKAGQQFPPFTSPLAATQQHPQMSNTAHRGERGDAQNPAHVMPQVLQNMV